MDAFEVAIDDVEVVYVRSPKQESEPDVPVCLLACTEDYNVVYILPFLKQHCACEGGSKGGDFFGIQQCTRCACLVEEC